MLTAFAQHQLAVKKKSLEKKLAQTGFEPVHATWHSLEDTELNHQTIWTVAQLWLLCFDKDIFANNSVTKLKLKNLEVLRSNYFLLYLLVFEFCPQHVLELRLIILFRFFLFFFQERFIQSRKISGIPIFCPMHHYLLARTLCVWRTTYERRNGRQRYKLTVSCK